MMPISLLKWKWENSQDHNQRQRTTGNEGILIMGEIVCSRDNLPIDYATLVVSHENINI